jgi:hypothetical protein
MSAKKKHKRHKGLFEIIGPSCAIFVAMNAEDAGEVLE